VFRFYATFLATLIALFLLYVVARIAIPIINITIPPEAKAIILGLTVLLTLALIHIVAQIIGIFMHLKRR